MRLSTRTTRRRSSIVAAILPCWQAAMWWLERAQCSMRPAAAGSDPTARWKPAAATPGTLKAATGSDIAALATPTQIPASLQAAPVDLVLSAIDPFAGDLVMQQGASIHGDVGATIGLHAAHQLTIDGLISAPAGS